MGHLQGGLRVVQFAFCCLDSSLPADMDMPCGCVGFQAMKLFGGPADELWWLTDTALSGAALAAEQAKRKRLQCVMLTIALEMTKKYLAQPFQKLGTEAWRDLKGAEVTVLGNANPSFKMLDNPWSTVQSLTSPESNRAQYRLNLDLTDTAESITAYLEFVAKHQWIDTATRAVSVSFSLFNPSLVTLTTYVISFELKTNGNVKSKM